MKLGVALLALLVLILPAAAQVTVQVATVTDNGFLLVRGNATQVQQTFGANHPFPAYERLYFYEQQPAYTSLGTYVSPPYTYTTYTYNRVYISNYAYAKKGSTHKSLATVGGPNGVQEYKVTLTGTASLLLDLYAYGYLYDNAAGSVEIWDGATKLYGKSWNAAGSNYEKLQVPVSVAGTKDLKILVGATCTPSAQGTGSYDGYSVSLSCNFLVQGGGLWALKGKGCGAPAIGPATATPTKGTYFDVTLDKAPAKAPAMALLGTSDQLFWFMQLPLDLGYMGATGCALQVGFRWPYSLVADANGHADWKVYLSAYATGTYYIQWVVYDPAAPGGITLTQYGELKY